MSPGKKTPYRFGPLSPAIVFCVLSLFFSLKAGPDSSWADSPSKAEKGRTAGKGEDKRWGKDPFYLPKWRKGPGSADHGGLKLEGIIYRSGKGTAIINNTLLRTGDRIEGWELVTISKDRVVLKSASGALVLKMPKFSSIQPGRGDVLK